MGIPTTITILEMADQKETQSLVFSSCPPKILLQRFDPRDGPPGCAPSSASEGVLLYGLSGVGRDSSSAVVARAGVLSVDLLTWFGSWGVWAEARGAGRSS